MPQWLTRCCVAARRCYVPKAELPIKQVCGCRLTSKTEGITDHGILTLI